MKKLVFCAAWAVLFASGVNQVRAQNLLGDPNFDLTEVTDWTLQEFVTGNLNVSIDSAENLNNSTTANTPTRQIFLKPFAGGSTAGPNNLTNAVLTQTVPGTAGQEYNFSGYSRFEANYAGGVSTLAAGSPLGAVPSPTVNEFLLEFLNSSNSVIGSPISLNIKADRIAQSDFPEFEFANDNLFYQHNLSGVAPTGTSQVRVTAAARNMVFNTDPAQSAFYDSFGLHTTSAPEAEILLNPGLDDPSPTGLEAWTVVTNDPADPPSEIIVRTATFANHNALGKSGVWLSSFAGELGTEVDADISQTVDAIAGTQYTFTGWSRWEANFSGGQTTLSAGTGAGLASPTVVTMEMSFLDNMGAVLGSPTILDIKTARTAMSSTSNPNDNQWYLHTLNATAPAGAVDVRVSAIMLDGISTTGGQSAFFDEFALVASSAGTPGDFDGDGDVDGRDFLVWQRGESPAPLSASDLADWQGNYGAGSLAAVTSVPEPTTAIGLMGLVLGCLTRRRCIA